ncbi:MAG TPA: sulfotransferase, partial [Acidimicrobiia bacterium]
MGVFVVGMHRSGTSAIAAALEALGLDVGAPERLMAADAANPAGYYEMQEIGDLNDEILIALGGAWDCLPQTPDGWELEPAMTPYFRRAASIVGTRLAKNRWLIKDPRIAPLLPLWRRAVLDRCAAVVIVRDPMEVAWSLALRNGMPILTGLALWSEYNRRTLAGLSGLPVYVCNYDELVSDPLATMTSIRAALASWNELSADAPVEVAAARVKP